MKRRGNVVIGLSLALAVPLALTALLELGLRLSPWDEELGPDRFHGRVPGNHPFWAPSNVLTGGFDRQLHDNEFRRARVTEEKPPGVFRIICLGGSFTYGWPHNKPEEAADIYPAVLQALLNGSRAEGEPRYEVINAGVGGYTSYQGLLYLRKRLLRFKPDLIVVAFGANDGVETRAIGMTLTDREYYAQWADGERGSGSSAIRSLRQHSRVVALVDHGVRAARLAMGPTRPRVSPAEFRQNLEAMNALGREQGFKVVLLYELSRELRSPEQMPQRLRYYSALDELGRQSEAEPILLDNLSLAEKERRRLDDLFVDTNHLSKEGHRWLARFIHGELRRRQDMGLPIDLARSRP